MSSQASRRRFTVAALAVALGFPLASHAQQPTDKPLRMVVIVAPGGSADFFARMLAEKLQASLKRTVIVENRPGAGGNLATSLVARSEADGTTLLFTSNNHNINPHIYKQPGYSHDRDFTPVAQVSRGPAVLVVHPSVPVTNLKEYVEHSRKTPMFYATYGGGSAAHLAGELLKSAANMNIEHVPYKGAGPALNEVLGGQVPSAILSLFATSPHIKAGKLRPIAVFSKERSPAFPDVPTVAESGYPDVVYDIWLGIMAPKGTPASVVAALNREIRSVLTDAGNSSKVRDQAMLPVDEAPEAFGAFLKTEAELVERIITKSKIEVQ